MPTEQNKRRFVAAPEHPLATKWGGAQEHRIILYDAIGAGPHRCHWCGRTIFWPRTPGYSREKGIEADHLDGDASNNRPSNLVAACRRCNTWRSRPQRIGRGERYIKKWGARMRAEQVQCQQCGKIFLAIARERRRGKGRFCSLRCVSRFHHPKVYVRRVSSAGHSYPAHQRNCEICGKPFLAAHTGVRNGKGRFCSISCANRSMWRTRPTRIKEDETALVRNGVRYRAENLKCKQCGKRFLAQPSHHRAFCCKSCSVRYQWSHSPPIRSRVQVELSAR
jgi:hypothetical protein